MGMLGSLAHGTTRLVTGTTALAGAAGGAAVGGVVGAVRGAVRGAGTGAQTGPSSTPAKALGFAALGVTGLLDWPVVAAAGAGALVIDRLSRRERDGAEDGLDADLLNADLLDADLLDAEVPDGNVSDADDRQPRIPELTEQPSAPPTPQKVAPARPAKAAPARKTSTRRRASGA